MNQRDLQYFKCIAETKSVSKAAKELFIAQPSLSQALKKIEDEIGTPLFIRHHRGMDLTLAGEKYYLAAKEILNIYDDFKSEVSYINNLKKGRLTIGTVSFLGSYILPRILPEFIKKYPNIEIYLEEDLTAPLEKLIIDANVDLAILHVHLKNIKNSIDYEKLYKDPFVLLAKKNHKIKDLAVFNKNISKYEIDLKSLKDEKFIVLNKDQGIRKISEILWNEAGIIPNISFSTKNFETGKKLAAEGVGLILLPELYTKMFNDGCEFDTYAIANTPNAYWETCIATRSNTYTSKIAYVFIEVVREYFKNNTPL